MFTRAATVPVGLLFLAISKPAIAQELVPAGSINAAVGGANKIIAVQDDLVVRRHAEAIRRAFFRGAEMIDDSQSVEKSLAGRNLIVYGTPAHAWLRKHQERLPFRYQDGAVLIEGLRFEGTRLRVICAIRNPDDLQQRALLYTSAKVEDIPGINSIFHGPTEWVVADGTRILAARSFMGRPLTVEHMLADLEELIAIIRKVHPATLADFPLELKKAIDCARSELTEPLRRDRFWLVLSRVLHTLHDAHSSIDPPSSGELLAMSLVWTDEGLMISKNSGPLRKGDRVVRLGAHTEPQLFELLREVIPAENDHWVRHRGETILKDLGILRTLKISTKAPVPILVERDGEQLEVDVTLAVVARTSQAVPWVRFQIEEHNNLGVFVLDQCINNEFYRKTLQQFFAEVRVKNITRIAIDVRRNSGGNSSVVNELLRYLDIDGYSRYGGVIRMSAGQGLIGLIGL